MWKLLFAILGLVLGAMVFFLGFMPLLALIASTSLRPWLDAQLGEVTFSGIVTWGAGTTSTIGFLVGLVAGHQRDTRELARDYLPTHIVLAYFLTIVAWMYWGMLTVVRFFGAGKVDGWAICLLAAISVALTIYVQLKGKQAFRTFRHTKGRIVISPVQSLLVMLVVAILVGLAMLSMWQITR